MKDNAVTVKFKSVSVLISPAIGANGKTIWRFRLDGERFTRSCLDKAKKEAFQYCKNTYSGGLSVDDLTQDQIRACKRIIEVDPRLEHVDEFILWLKKRVARKNCGDAVKEFLVIKEDNLGDSKKDYWQLKMVLERLPLAKDLMDITPSDLPRLKGAPRTRKNVRDKWISFFKWCKEREYLPLDRKTAPELLEKPKVVQGVPETFTPAELQTLLDGVVPQYRPWLALCSLGAMRSGEIIPDSSSSKTPLAWEDIHFDRDLIIVPAHVSKTKKRRVIPICPALKAWLEPFKGRTGRVGPQLSPGSPSTHGAMSETKRLGLLLDGGVWKRNALRHSYVSYRVAQGGSGAAAREAGNSEAITRSNYEDAKSPEQAEAWFNVMPSGPMLVTHVTPKDAGKYPKISQRGKTNADRATPPKVVSA